MVGDERPGAAPLDADAVPLDADGADRVARLEGNRLGAPLEPRRGRRPRAAVPRLRAPVVRQQPEEAGKVDDPAEPGGADVGGCVQQRAQQRRGVQPRAAKEPVDGRAPQQHSDVRPVLVRQRGALDPALAAAHHHELLAREHAEIAVV